MGGGELNRTTQVRCANAAGGGHRRGGRRRRRGSAGYDRVLGEPVDTGDFVYCVWESGGEWAVRAGGAGAVSGGAGDARGRVWDGRVRGAHCCACCGGE